jgi:hypothetical protein
VRWYGVAPASRVVLEEKRAATTGHEHVDDKTSGVAGLSGNDLRTVSHCLTRFSQRNAPDLVGRRVRISLTNNRVPAD